MSYASGGSGAFGSVAVGDPDPWVEMSAFQPTREPRDREHQYGECHWLSDLQIDLTGARRTRFSRTVKQVTGAEGLQQAAVATVSFDPSYEQLTFHRVCVTRAGQERHIDPRMCMQVLRREPDLERAIYDGRLTAHLTIPDIRVGDLVDVAFSVAGERPIVGGRFAEEWLFDWDCWVGETRVRLRAKQDRQFVIRTWNGAPEPETRLEGDICERVWTARERPRAELETDMPSWVRPYASVRVCDRMSWMDVADVFAPLYASRGELPAELEAEIAPLARLSPRDRAVEALRLVQTALRYQSVSIGEGGFAPRELNEIWASRSGDCKDASRLLTEVLTRLGLSACPTLVNTWRGDVLDEEPPSLLAFDHCLVQLLIDGETRWLDPTLAPQAGSLDQIYQPRFGWCLPLRSGAQLTPMGKIEPAEVFEMVETLGHGRRPTDTIDLDVKVQYSSWAAEGERRRWASDPHRAEREIQEQRRAEYGEVELVDAVRKVDDQRRNIFEVAATYRAPSPWKLLKKAKLAELQLQDAFIERQLGAPPNARRKWPLNMGRPRRIRHVYEIRLPAPLQAPGWDDTYRGPSVTARIQLQVDRGGRTARFVRELEVREPCIPPSQVPAFADFRSEVLSHSGAVLRVAVRNDRFHTPPRNLLENIEAYWGRWLVVIFFLAYWAAALLGV